VGADSCALSLSPKCAAPVAASFALAQAAVVSLKSQSVRIKNKKINGEDGSGGENEGKIE
jgi:hypothetical protein